jgi:membrane protein implicated in regulation of membrane protease activity
VNLGDLDPAWLWLIGAALLAVTELAIPGVFLVWIAAAALLTALVTFVTGIGLPAQLIIFAVAAIAMVLTGRQAYARMSHTSSDPLLNDRAARLIGQTVIVADAIVNGRGRVTVGDGIWSARGADAPAGARVTIVGLEGGCLVVTPADALPGPTS